MKNHSFERKWRKKSRLLSHLLLISGSVNIALVATFCYFAFSKENRLHLEKSQKKVQISQTNAEVIKSFFQSSFDELLYELKDKTLLENGYTRRDLALAYLAAYHYVNLDQALSGFSYQKRSMTFLHSDGGEKFELVVYPGLKDEHFLSILSFIQKEAWPFTPEGLYYELCHNKQSMPGGLKEAFFATPHFHSVYTLIARGEPTISREEVLVMLLEGNWQALNQFYKEQRLYADYSFEQRKAFLHSYVKLSSIVASYLLIQLEPDYPIKKMDDQDLIQLIRLLNRKTLSSAKFLKQLLISLRTDEIRKESAKMLYQYEGISLSEPIDYQKALIDFLPSVVPQKNLSQPTFERQSHPSYRIHVVKEGDSLWKIAKEYKVEINEIIAENNLSNTHLLPVGKKLKIPKK